MSTNKKLDYEGPVCEVFEVRAEECILQVSNGVNWAETEGAVSGHDTYSDGEGY